MAEKSIEDVKNFWESNPLWTGESAFKPGSKEFFEEHRQVYITDCFAGKFDLRCVPDEVNQQKVLDLGSGPGFWTVELAQHGCHDMTAADLTKNALELCERRCQIYGVNATFSQQNAENLTFDENIFTHVNCQGVIHHTPNTETCVQEIARVLKPGGTASISVYHRNIFLKTWPLIKWVGKIIHTIGGGIKGRGRENIFAEEDVNEIVRLYDGADNPIGKAYTKAQFYKMLSAFFEVQEIYFHFFPARALPFPIPKFLHKLLDKYAGFMMYATVRKR
ncbi:hypothetical protein PN36_17540 [Candidatus Thiomargarita nelsonii]|uniref:Methyltransferase domain-containing protein n=1 Tax=Candidatus Thiomargarita nelsonii TaxID=1003181 RepID=A0A4E0RS03_9GAMM|nr:hypothetical protein PN36_17540 [Candidatus Thiomargarita nelsonii]